MKNWLVRAGVVLLSGYAMVCTAARLTYRRFVYPAPPPHGRLLPDAEALLLHAADGRPVHALWFAPPATAPVVAYFHGNGETIDDDVSLARDLVRRGFGALLVEYRGYGASAGETPTEAGLYADAEAALDEAARRGAGSERIALWGTSLGTGVAAEMARRRRGSALVLVSPFTSLVEVASRTVTWLPVSLLLPDRYDTLAKAPQILVPTLVVHGDEDQVIPFAMGQAVARAIAGARFLGIEHAGHADVYDRGGRELMSAIVEHLRASR